MSTAMRRIPQDGILSSVVVTAGAATAGYGAVLDTTDLECNNAGANAGTVIGVHLDTAAAAAKARIQISGVAAVKVAAGGATRGTLAAVAAAGFQDIPAPNTAGATTTYCYGRFVQTGVSGDVVGLNLDCAGGTVITA